mgnify:CR=1 FL=1|tara:strand:+ start:372 stop:560 length:189 start_codon:yes stop_codon:yes gene_type:complete
MTMQLKFNNSRGLGQSISRKIVKALFVIIILVTGIFLIDKIDFPSPKQDIKKDITNETIKLK